MDILFKTLLSENIEEIDTIPNTDTSDEFSDEVKTSVSELSDIQKDDYISKVQASELENIKANELKIIDDFDENNLDLETKVDEYITDSKSLINRASVIIESIDSLELSYANILFETSNIYSINEAIDISNIFSALYNAIINFIKTVKEKYHKFIFTLLANIDFYGKWVDKNKDDIRLLKKVLDNSNTTYIDMDTHKWNVKKLYSFTEFDNLYNRASTIIGNATSKDKMKDKLKEYEDRNWDKQKIYSYLLADCVGIKAKEVKGTIEDARNKIISEVMGNKLKCKATSERITMYEIGLKNLKSEVIKMNSKIKNKITNEELDKLAELCKTEMADRSDKPDSVKYKYYQARYEVLSIAQNVAFDLYAIKTKLLIKFANEAKQFISGTMREVAANESKNNESIDYMAMNNDFISGDILNESYVDKKE